jgi:hypothetical protein
MTGFPAGTWRPTRAKVAATAALAAASHFSLAWVARPMCVPCLPPPAECMPCPGPPHLVIMGFTLLALPFVYVVVCIAAWLVSRLANVPPGQSI